MNFISNFYFSPRGRTSRKMYWLFGVLVQGVAAFLLALFLVLAPISMAVDQWLALFVVILLIFVWVGFAIGSRRLHDFGVSAWWMLLIYFAGLMLGIFEQIEIAQLVGLLWTVFLGIVPGQIGANRFGADPKQDVSFVIGNRGVKDSGASRWEAESGR